MSDSEIKLEGERLNAEQELLRPYFEKVQPTTHWKDSIDAFCRVEEAGLVGRAIDFFTATQAIFTLVNPGWFRVTAAGYRRGPAGDH